MVDEGKIMRLNGIYQAFHHSECWLLKMISPPIWFGSYPLCFFAYGETQSIYRSLNHQTSPVSRAVLNSPAKLVLKSRNLGFAYHQLIGLREELQETPIFHGNIYGFQ